MKLARVLVVNFLLVLAVSSAVSGALLAVDWSPTPAGPAPFEVDTGTAISHIMKVTTAIGAVSLKTNPFTPTKGDRMWVFVMIQSNAVTVTSIAFTAGESYSNISSAHVSDCEVFSYESFSAVGATETVTASVSLTVVFALEVVDMTAVASPAKDGSFTSTGSNSTLFSHTSTAASGEPALVAGCIDAGRTTGTYTPTDTYVDRNSVTNVFTGVSWAVLYGGVGPASVSAVMNSSANWALIAITIKNAAVPPAPTAFTVSSVSSTTISVAWTNPVGVVLNDTVFLQTGGCSGPAVQYSAGDASSYSVIGLLATTTYCLFATAWNSTGQSADSGTATATTKTPIKSLSVTNFTTPLPVSPEIWGTDIRPDAYFNVSDAENLAHAGVLTWRYPGGNVVETYNYTTNYREPNNTKFEINSISNFITMCNLVGCHALLQLPAEINSPSTVAFYVNYIVNTLHFKPWIWEIGNEPALYDNFLQPWTQWNVGPNNSAANPTTYAAIIPSLINAVRQYDGTTPVDPIGGMGGGTSNDAAWVEALVAADGANFQDISIHSYPAGSQKTSNASFYGNLHGTTPFYNVVTTSQNAVTTICPACKIPILVTEMGASTGQANHNYETNFTMDMWDAATSIMGLDAGAATIMPYAYHNGYPGSFIVANNGPLMPSYYFYKDVAQFLGTSVLNVSLNNSDLGKFQVGATYAVGNQWAMLLVNLDTSHSNTVNIAGSGFPSHGAIAVYNWSAATPEPVGFGTNWFNSTTIPANTMELILVKPLPVTLRPSAPIGLYVAGTIPSAVWISWTQPSGSVTSNVVEYGTPVATPAPYCTVTGTFTPNVVASGFYVTGLTGSVTYCFAVAAVNAAGTSAYSSFVNATTPLGPPTGFATTSVGPRYIAMAWTNPTTSLTINHIWLDVGYLSSTGVCSIVNFISLGDVTSDNLTGLLPATFYCMYLQAHATTGNGTVGATISVQTLGGAPSAPTLDAHTIAFGNTTFYNSSAITVTAGDAILVGIGVRGGTLLPTVKDSVGDKFTLLSGAATSVSPGSSFQLYAAFNSSGGSVIINSDSHGNSPGVSEIMAFSGVASIALDSLGWGRQGGAQGGEGGPNPYDALNTSQINDVMAFFTGMSSSKGGGVTFTGSSISVLDQASHWSLTSGATVYSGADGEATEAAITTNHNLSMTSNTSGTSYNWFTLSVSLRGSSTTAPPTGLHVTGFSPSYVNLTWANPSGTWKNDTVYYTQNQLTFTADYIGSVVTSAQITGLSAGKLYYFMVEIINSGGQFGNSFLVGQFTYNMPPGPPTNFAVASQTTFSVTLGWVQPVGGGILNNTVFVNSNGVSTSYSLPPSTAFTYNGIVPYVNYTFEVSASTNGGIGANATLLYIAQPTPPSNLNVASRTFDTVSLTWFNPFGIPGPTNDTVWYGNSCGALNFTVSTSGAVQNFTVPGLQPQTAYCFAIQAWTNNANSPLSPTVTTITPPQSTSPNGTNNPNGTKTQPSPIVCVVSYCFQRITLTQAVPYLAAGVFMFGGGMAIAAVGPGAQARARRGAGLFLAISGLVILFVTLGVTVHL